MLDHTRIAVKLLGDYKIIAWIVVAVAMPGYTNTQSIKEVLEDERVQ